jgi:hypothetical protein
LRKGKFSSETLEMDYESSYASWTQKYKH